MDLHVVGAGPAGLISAISAIREHNCKVHVSEEHKLCGVPVNCSGVFSADGLESLKDYVDYRKTVTNALRGATIDFSGVRFEVRTKRDIAYACDRAALDRLLAERAESEGAEIAFNEKVRGGGAFLADNIIGADGPNSAVASHFGFPKMTKFVCGAQKTLKYRADDRHCVEIFLSGSKFPGFFGWVIPRDEENAEFGCGVELPADALRAFRELLKLKGMRGADGKGSVSGVSAAVIPIATRRITAMAKNGMSRSTEREHVRRNSGDKNVLLVGDAAGQVKASTGGGVVFGGNCAKLAGKHFRAPVRYELSWRRRFGFDLFLHGIVQERLFWKNDKEMAAFGRKLKMAGFEKYLSEKGHMDKPSRMFSPELVPKLLSLL